MGLRPSECVLPKIRTPLGAGYPLVVRFSARSDLLLKPRSVRTSASMARRGSWPRQRVGRQSLTARRPVAFEVRFLRESTPQAAGLGIALAGAAESLTAFPGERVRLPVRALDDRPGAPRSVAPRYDVVSLGVESGGTRSPERDPWARARWRPPAGAFPRGETTGGAVSRHEAATLRTENPLAPLARPFASCGPPPACRRRLHRGASAGTVVRSSCDR